MKTKKPRSRSGKRKEYRVWVELEVYDPATDEYKSADECDLPYPEGVDPGPDCVHHGKSLVDALNIKNDIFNQFVSYERKPIEKKNRRPKD